MLNGQPAVAPIADYSTGSVESCLADASYLSDGYGRAYCVPASDLAAPAHVVACAFADRYPSDMNVETCDRLSNGAHYAQFRKEGR